MTGIILIVLGLLLLALIIMIVRKGKTTSPLMPQQDLASLDITDARHKDVVSILGLGDDFEDLDFTVDRKNRYESGGEKWYEVSGMYKGRRVFAEYHEDDELEVTVNLGKKKVKLADLNQTESDLVRMDEERSSSNGFEFEGLRWNYDSSNEVGFFQDGLGGEEGYYCWNFTSQDNLRQLFIEKWEGDPFEGGIAEVVNPSDVKVFRS